jgi:hypothetical protein
MTVPAHAPRHGDEALRRVLEWLCGSLARWRCSAS